MKQVRPLGRVTAGPESKILEGGSVLEERVAGDGEASRPYSAAGDGRDMPYEYKVRTREMCTKRCLIGFVNGTSCFTALLPQQSALRVGVNST